MISDLHAVTELLEGGFSKVRALVIGDLILDRYIIGDVDRISPEAPVPVLRHIESFSRPGGAANVAMNLAGLGCQVELIGFWGNDPEREELLAKLKAASVEASNAIETTTPTISKTRIVSRRQQLIRLDVESAAAYQAIEMEALASKALSALTDANVIILSDYAKGALSTRICQTVIQEARRKSIPVLVDPKCADFGKYAGATTVCPNLSELSAATGVPADDIENLLQAGDDLIETHNLDFLTVTMSQHGITVLGPEMRFHSPARAREVFDVSGAGDTVIATLAAAIAAGLSLQSAVELCNVAAGIVVSKVGTVPIAARELRDELTAKRIYNSTDKLLSRQQLLQQIAAWREANETIVFTNGCFDLLHVGHVQLLEDCAQFGSKVVLGLNTDASVRRLKGPTRPVISESSRARVMAALASVDAVTLFDEDTPLELIQAIQPDVLVKGGDYTTETVVGHEDVLSWGGQVKIVPTVEGFSTTNIVRKLTTGHQQQ